MINFTFPSAIELVDKSISNKSFFGPGVEIAIGSLEVFYLYHQMGIQYDLSHVNLKKRYKLNFFLQLD